MPEHSEKWLAWARRLQVIADAGLTYSREPFDRERFEALREIVAEILADHAGADLGAARLLLDGEQGYATPKVDVRAAVFRDGRILMVRERSDRLWTLPGGWADAGDAPSAAVEREVREESGYEARARKLALVYDRDRHGHPPFAFAIYKLFFVCELTGGAPAQSLETEDVGWFPADALPALSLTRVNPAEIERLFAHHRDMSLPTEFD